MTPEMLLLWIFIGYSIGGFTTVVFYIKAGYSQYYEELKLIRDKHWTDYTVNNLMELFIVWLVWWVFLIGDVIIKIISLKIGKFKPFAIFKRITK